MSTSKITPAQVTVSTASATAVATRCHLFTIEGYNRIKSMYTDGRSIESCGFEAAGRTWRILFFPNGTLKGIAHHASVFLKLDSDSDADDDSNVLVEFKFSLLCDGGTSHSREPLTATFSSKGSKATNGYASFIMRMDLENSRFVRGDRLVIRCDMAVLHDPVGVKSQAVQAHDLKSLGVVCSCKEDDCKSYHLRGLDAFRSRSREAIAKLFLGCFHL